MNRDDIIRMAREASGGTTWWPIHVDILERFAALVAAAEREDCAKLCDPEPSLPNEAYAVDNTKASMRRCAAAIRARGTP